MSQPADQKVQGLNKLILTPEVRHGASSYINKPIVRLPSKSSPEIKELTRPATVYDQSKIGNSQTDTMPMSKNSSPSPSSVNASASNKTSPAPKNGIVLSKASLVASSKKSMTTPAKINSPASKTANVKLSLTKTSSGVSLTPSPSRFTSTAPKTSMISTNKAAITTPRTNSPSSKLVPMTLTTVTAASTSTASTAQTISKVKVTSAATTIPASSAVPAAYLPAPKTQTLSPATKRAFHLVTKTTEDVTVPQKKLKVLEPYKPQSKIVIKNEMGSPVGTSSPVTGGLNSVARVVPVSTSSPVTMVVTAADGNITSYNVAAIIRTNPRLALSSTGSIIRPVTATGTPDLSNIQFCTLPSQAGMRSNFVGTSQKTAPTAVIKTEPIPFQIGQSIFPRTSLPSMQSNSNSGVRIQKTVTLPLPLLLQDRSLLAGNKLVKSGSNSNFIGRQQVVFNSSNVMVSSASPQTSFTSIPSTNLATSLVSSNSNPLMVTIKEEIASPPGTTAVVKDPGKNVPKFLPVSSMNKAKNTNTTLPSFTANNPSFQSNSSSQKQVVSHVHKDKHVSGSHAQKHKTRETMTLHSEIRTLLHGFGDSPDPMQETVEMMESILKQELGGFIHLCDNYASISNTKLLGFQEAILVLKTNKMRVFRMYKHFGYKDWGFVKAQQLRKTGPVRYYTREITEIVRNLNLVDIAPLIDISMTDLEKTVEETDEMRNAEVRARRLGTSRKFLDYSIVRAVSFALKLPMEILQTWVTAHLHCEAKLSKDFLEILSFLLFEVVAELLHVAFSIQQERGQASEPLPPNPRGVNPDTCMSAPHFQKKRKDDECNQVSEILVQASEMEAKRLTKKGSTGDKKLSIMHGRALYPGTTSISLKLKPGSLREAYMRYQDDSNCPPCSFRVRAERLRRFVC